jgi:hypothetical protein
MPIHIIDLKLLAIKVQVLPGELQKRSDENLAFLF